MTKYGNFANNDQYPFPSIRRYVQSQNTTRATHFILIRLHSVNLSRLRSAQESQAALRASKPHEACHDGSTLQAHLAHYEIMPLF